MKIGCLIQCTNLGGMEQATLRLLTKFLERGHTSRMVSLSGLGPLAPAIVAAGIPVHGCEYRGRYGWRSAISVRRALAEAKFDAFLAVGHSLVGTLASFGMTPVSRSVLAMHFHHEGVKPPWQWRLIYATAVRRFHAITFPSDFVRREAERLYPPLARKTLTVRNPLELPVPTTSESRAAARAALGLSGDEPLVGNAGWLIPRKRWDVFLSVAQAVRRRHPDVRFVIAGDGPERHKLQTLARASDLEGSVVWLGWQRELTSFYRAIDVLLFNSNWDAFPTTPLEAMAHGVPVVASVVHGGLQEVLTAQGAFGFLSDRHDPKVLADQIGALLNDPGKRARLGAAGRDRVADLCDAESATKTMEALLGGTSVRDLR